MSIPIIHISVSEFRAQFPSLYKKYLSPESTSLVRVVVKDFKANIELFELTKVDPEEGKKKILENIKQINKNRGKIKFDFDDASKMREKIDNDFRKKMKKLYK